MWVRFLKNRGPGPVEGPWVWRSWLRKARNWLLAALVFIAITDLFGLPHLRWEYVYYGSDSSRQYVRATYLGMTGVRHVEAGQYGQGCPLVLFLKPKTPLSRKILDQTQSWIRG